MKLDTIVDFPDMFIPLTGSRLENLFSTLRTEKRGGLVVYIVATDPDFEMSLNILENLPSVGVDVIELGIPFSDPTADGPTLQQAAKRSLQAGGSLTRTLTLARAFRTYNNTTPLVLMGYYNPIYIYGIEKFSVDAALSGVDGCIVVDLPPEEAEELVSALRNYGINFIFLTAPTTGCSRLPIILKQASGFIYYISITGITGTTSATQQTVIQAIKKLRRKTSLPITVGFGLSVPSQVSDVASVADAAVVGSAIVQRIATSSDQKISLVDNVLRFISTLSFSAHKAAKE